MPTNDLTPAPSADDIRHFEFATVRRGYDPDQVRDYLMMAAGRVETLEREVDAAEASLASVERAATAPAVAAPTGESADPYEAFAKRFAGLLGTADREAERLVEEAKAESARIVDEARADADRIRVDAQARAEEARAEGRQVLEEARAEAERALSTLASRRQQLVDQLGLMQSRLITAAHDLDVVIEEDPDDLPAPIAQAEAGLAPEDTDERAGPEGSSADEVETTDRPAGDGSSSEPRASEPADAGLDPRYEDLWVSDEDVELPNLTAIEFDFDTSD